MRVQKMFSNKNYSRLDFWLWWLLILFFRICPETFANMITREENSLSACSSFDWHFTCSQDLEILVAGLWRDGDFKYGSCEIKNLIIWYLSLNPTDLVSDNILNLSWKFASERFGSPHPRMFKFNNNKWDVLIDWEENSYSALVC